MIAESGLSIYPFKQNASRDSLFDVVPRTDTQVVDGVTSTWSVDGSISFDGLDVTLAIRLTETDRGTDSTGATTDFKSVLNGTFTGTKK